MACNTPLLAHFLGFDENGKPIISYSRSETSGKPLLMDCGRCLGCRLRKSKEWAVRCMKELEYWNEACFVTLTYNDNCLPYVYDKGIDVFPTLVRKHVIEFNKRLRTALSRLGYNDKIKVYYCGEYGDASQRPHYHLLIFGFKPFDLEDYKKDKFGYQLYNSKFLESLWYHKSPELDKTKRRKWKKVPRGFVVVGDVSFNSCSYVARYLLKKQYFINENLLPVKKEFLGVSKGIGLRWLEDNYKTVFANGYINYVHNNKIKKCSIPRYFIEKLKTIDEVLYIKVKSEAYDFLQKKIDYFNDELNKLDDKTSNELFLHKRTFERFIRSFDNEESL